MTGKELLHTGRLWTESALDEALHLVSPGAPHQRLRTEEARALRQRIEKSIETSPVGSGLDATLRIDGTWDARVMSAILSWLSNAGIIESKSEGHDMADLVNRLGIVISAPVKAPPSHRCAPPTEEFSRVMDNSGLARIYLAGGPSDSARDGRWSEVIVHRRGAQSMPATDVAWIDPALHGGKCSSGLGSPDSEVMLRSFSDSEAQMFFGRDFHPPLRCPDNFTKWCFIFRVALATSAAAGCLDASRWAKKNDGTPAVLPKIAELFRLRASTILKLALEM